MRPWPCPKDSKRFTLVFPSAAQRAQGSRQRATSALPCATSPSKSIPLCKHSEGDGGFSSFLANTFLLYGEVLYLLSHSMQMLQCTKCSQVKTEDNFATDRKKKSGKHSHCRDCNRENVALWRELNPERSMEITRKSGRRYHATEKGKATQKAANARYPKIKIRAVSIANYLLRKGVIARDGCELCENPVADMHHEDYSKPSEIRWLCRRHHKQLHAGRFSLLTVK